MTQTPPIPSQLVGVAAGIETTVGTVATAAWMQMQPNASGIKGFFPDVKDVARMPLSPNMTAEKGDIVDLDAAPSIAQDFDLDWMAHFDESMFRSARKYAGGTGTGFWQVWPSGNPAPANIVALGAITATSIAVTSGGALPAGTLLACLGFANPLNNGIRVVGASSTATSIVVSGGAIEATPPVGARVVVAGFQFTSGDAAITVSGSTYTLTTTTQDLTLLGIPQWSWLCIGSLSGATATTTFANAADSGIARATSIAAHAITLDRTGQAFVADPGSTKTIRIAYGWWLRTVAATATDQKMVGTAPIAHTLELQVPGLGAAGATAYCYATGAAVGKVEINAQGVNKTVVTTDFVGFTVTNPSVTRLGGTAPPLTMAPMLTGAFNTANEIQRLRVTDQASGTVMLQDIQNWKLTINLNVTPYKKQGALGNAATTQGMLDIQVGYDATLVQSDFWIAASTFNTLAAEKLYRNNDGGVLFDVPACTADMQDPQFGQTGPITFSPNINVFRDPISNFALAATVFPYLPL